MTCLKGMWVSAKSTLALNFKSVKHFVLPRNAKVIESDFELDGYDVNFLERNKIFKIKIRSFFTKVIDGITPIKPGISEILKFVPLI